MSFTTSSYTPDNLAALLSEAQDAQLMSRMGASGYEVSGLTYDEMLNYAPASMTTRYPNPALNGLGAADSLLTPFFMVLAAGTLAYILFVPKERRITFFG